jgi:outer membrane protein assembly factor BamB
MAVALSTVRRPRPAGYVGSLDGCLHALKSTTGEKLWSCRIGIGLCASPAVSDGVVSAASQIGRVYAFGRAG